MKDVLTAFDVYLAEQGLSLEATVIGGAALIIMGTVSRTTQDVDVLTPLIPEPVAKAAKEFAASRTDLALKPGWLNNGPKDVAAELPKGWADRCVPLFDGNVIKLSTLGRSDLLASKLFAYVYRFQDFEDCVALLPLRGELVEIRPWLNDLDALTEWPAVVTEALNGICQRLGYERFE